MGMRLRRVRIKRPAWAVSVKAVIAELVATALFVYIGTGAAVAFSSRHSDSLPFTRQSVTASSNTTASLQELDDRLQINGSWGVTTALAFGLAITVMAYATAHLSGGQLNPTVSFALACVGALPVAQAAANICAQVVGAILGSAFLAATIPNGQRLTLGSNQINPGVGYGNALCGEIIMTFVLNSVVLETAVNKKSVARAQAPLAIGFAVFCAHAVLLPIDGCSINPARSLGPAIVSGTWPGTFWVFVVGPFLGALAAVPFHLFFRSDYDTLPIATDPVDLRASSSLATPNERDGKHDEGRRVQVETHVAAAAEEGNVADIVAQADTSWQRSDTLAAAAGGGLAAHDEHGRVQEPALVMV